MTIWLAFHDNIEILKEISKKLQNREIFLNLPESAELVIIRVMIDLLSFKVTGMSLQRPRL